MMSEAYNPAEIEARWQDVWYRTGIYEPDIQRAKRPYYNLMMFPYPSAEGVIKFESTPRNTPRVHVFAAAPWGLRLHGAKVGGVMPLTLPYLRVG
jgi:hypothetical protein